jgi:SAM-dependent methyltransferase
MNSGEEAVGSYYDDVIFDAERVRLPRDFPVELAITRRRLDRHIPDAATVAEIGVGGAVYSELLARRGCRLRLVDISRKLLDAAIVHLREAGLEDRILGSSQESATALGSLDSDAFDAVLMLGPLYHLRLREERCAAVAEAARILKRGGVLFAAGINRIAYLRALFAENPTAVVARREFHDGFLIDGNLDPEHAPPLGFAHLSSIEEFRALFRDRFEEIEVMGVESFTSHWQKQLNDLEPVQQEAWLELVERTGKTAEGLGQSDHFLYVGRRID